MYRRLLLFFLTQGHLILLGRRERYELLDVEQDALADTVRAHLDATDVEALLVEPQDGSGQFRVELG